MSPARDRPGSHGVRAARPRRRGVSHRHQVEDRARSAARTQKYVTCNADEGDSGTFADRMLMEGDPFALIEGMTIAGLAVGATQGYIYLRVEYPHAHRALHEAIARAYERGYLGRDILRQRQGVRPRSAARRGRVHLRRRDLDARKPRGQARRSPRAAAAAGDQGPLRPADARQQRHLARERADHPAQGRRVLSRLRHGQVARHAAAPARRQHQARRAHRAGVRPHAARAALRLRRRLGQRAGRFARCRSAGRSAPTFPRRSSTRRSTTRRLSASARCSGHGGIVVFDDTVDMAHMARYAMEFCAIESCGKCTPCRIGSTRGVEVIDRIIASVEPRAEPALLEELCETHAARLAVRARRHDAVPGAERAEALSRRFPRATACSCDWR